ncbi:MAG: DNA gyrase inhibitor YacG [Deltaproteobacteria bacterium]|nr:DNA gyrase inhibitor YacG [Deltaproteobacteria bacterium]
MDRAPRCPTCRAGVRREDNPHRPFCSERCRLVDLGGWVTEQYRIPGAALGNDLLDDDDEGEIA